MVADRPIPSFLNRFYFEVNVENTDGSSLTVEKLSGFFIGLWVGNSGLFADDEVSKNIPADVNHSKWYHPVNGRVVASGKVVKDLSFKGIEDIKINVASSNSVVVGCGWDIEKNEVFFTCDGSILGGSNVRSTNTAPRIDANVF